MSSSEDSTGSNEIVNWVGGGGGGGEVVIALSFLLENIHTNVLERLRNYVTARDVI